MSDMTQYPSAPPSAVTPATMSAFRSLLIAVGTVIGAKYGFSGDDVTSLANIGMDIASAALVIGPALWGVIDKIRAEQKAKARETVAVQAGVAAARNGLPKSTSPEQISPAHAQQIIATNAPA